MKLSSINELSTQDAALFRSRCIRIFQCAIALAAVGTLALFAFAHLFTTFVTWDDEGYFLQAYRGVLSGRVLYDQVFALYGPLTFLIADLVARFDANNVTNDTFRWITLPVWIAIAALMAGIVWKLTRRFSPSLAAFLLVGFRLQGLAKGVGHPQLWIILAAALLLFLGLDSLFQESEGLRNFWIGALIGAILLLKINIGIFVAMGYLLAVGLLLKPRPRKVICGLALTATAAIGGALLFVTTTVPEKYFVLAFLLSVGATAGTALGRRDERYPAPVSLMWLAAGLAVCVCAGVGGTLAAGTTLRGLYDAFVTAPALLARNYHNPFLEPARRSSILLVAVAGGVAIFVWRAIVQGRLAWIGLLKVTTGIGLLCAFYYDHRLALTGSLLFLWLLIVDVPQMPEPEYSNRLLLGLLSAFFSLQIYPMAGEQVDWAALMPITSAAVLLADGMNCVARESRPMAWLRLTGFASGAAAIALTSVLFISVAGNARGDLQLWSQSQPLSLRGAHWLRLPPLEAARLTSATGELTRNCKAVLMLPGLYSFSLWSGVPVVEEKRINVWPFMWPNDVEKNELRKLPYESRGCALVTWDVYRFFETFAVSPGNGELLAEIQRTMIPIYTTSDITLYRSVGISDP